MQEHEQPESNIQDSVQAETSEVDRQAEPFGPGIERDQVHPPEELMALSERAAEISETDWVTEMLTRHGFTSLVEFLVWRSNLIPEPSSTVGHHPLNPKIRSLKRLYRAKLTQVVEAWKGQGLL